MRSYTEIFDARANTIERLTCVPSAMEMQAVAAQEKGKEAPPNGTSR